MATFAVWLLSAVRGRDSHQVRTASRPSPSGVCNVVFSLGGALGAFDCLRGPRGLDARASVWRDARDCRPDRAALTRMPLLDCRWQCMPSLAYRPACWPRTVQSRTPAAWRHTWARCIVAPCDGRTVRRHVPRRRHCPRGSGTAWHGGLAPRAAPLLPGPFARCAQSALGDSVQRTRRAGPGRAVSAPDTLYSGPAGP